MSIIVTKRGLDARKLEPSSIPQEDYLQQYVQKNPECLPMDEIREDLRLLVVAREFPTQSGPIDALAVDQVGELYLIETKLYKNPDKRRIIAQVLDYGALLWNSPGGAEGVIVALKEQCRALLGVPLEEKLESYFGLDPSEVDQILAQLQARIANGVFRFVVLMDRMDDRLKDLIRFVNENSRFTVYGVELEFYQFEDYEIAIPRIYGAEARKSAGQPVSRRRAWDETSFFEDAEARLAPEHVKCIRKLYDFSCQAADRITWGTGFTMGSFNPRFDHIGRPSLYTVYSDGRLSINFGALKGSAVRKEVTRRLAAGLTEGLGFELPSNYENSYPHFPIDIWCGKIPQIIELLQEVVKVSGAP